VTAAKDQHNDHAPLLMKSGATDGMPSSAGINRNNQRTNPMTKWLNNTLIEGDYLTVCFTEQEYTKALKSLKIPIADWDRWLSQDALATTHYFNTPKGNRVTIVCIPVKPEVNGVDVASLLVHEAVHVVQEYFRFIGEDNPGIEIEAYSIQNISAALMRAYRDRLFPKVKDKKDGLHLGHRDVQDSVHILSDQR
jgi:hypothetical protein